MTLSHTSFSTVDGEVVLHQECRKFIHVISSLTKDGKLRVLDQRNIEQHPCYRESKKRKDM